MTSLDAIAQDPAKAASLSPDERVKIQLRLAAVLAAIAGIPAANGQAEVPDEELTPAQAAAFLGVKVRWLHDHQEVPRRRYSRRAVRFSRKQLAEWKAERGMG